MYVCSDYCTFLSFFMSICLYSFAFSEMYGDSNDGSVPATFQVLYFIGWKPDQSQASMMSYTCTRVHYVSCDLAGPVC